MTRNVEGTCYGLRVLKAFLLDDLKLCSRWLLLTRFILDVIDTDVVLGPEVLSLEVLRKRWSRGVEQRTRNIGWNI